MQLVPTKLVREGQTVARDVRNSRGQILLVRGQRLTSSLIARLRKFEIEAVYLRDGYAEEDREPVKSELKHQLMDVLNAPFANVAREAKEKRLSVNVEALQEIMDSLIEALLSNNDPLLTLLDISSSSDRLLHHSVNATVLALLLAMDLGVSPGMYAHLATAMMFHDIGMALLPDEVTQKPGRLTPQEAELLRNHVNLGCRQLVQAKTISSVAANIILHHHEAMDGSGYPEGVHGDKLSLLARIACVAEVYDSLTSSRPYAPAVMPDAALTYILMNTGTRFAKEVTLALCRRVALYPTGTAVQLNTGESGIVASTAPEKPTRPIVRVMVDHRGRQLPNPQVADLTRDAARSVVRSAASMAHLLQARNPAYQPSRIDPLVANIC